MFELKFLLTVSKTKFKEKNINPLNIKKIKSIGSGVSTNDLSYITFKKTIYMNVKIEKKKENNPNIPRV
mgnify:CR=1 FL=1